MAAWVFLLGGLSVWGAHFLGVYGIASIFALDGSAARPASTAWIAGLTALCLLANGLLAAVLVRPAADPDDHWRRAVGLLGVGFSTLAVVWQALPALFLG
ncbi:MAG TPA: hypothetical protein PKA17_01380 [Phenylobacterium sp.]|nr:hypothetical protein [Phenylobacterium sp.]